jgi:RND family efflux transporter MFP subunit
MRALVVACLLFLVAAAAWWWIVARRKAAPVRPDPIAAVAPRSTATIAPLDAGFVGVLVPPQTVNLSSRLDGKLASVNVQLGQMVHRGDLLASLDKTLGKHDLATARATARAARAARAAAQVEVQRARDKVDRRDDAVMVGKETVALVSGEEAAQAKFDRDSALAKLVASSATANEQEHHAAQAATLLQEHELRAPFDGMIAGRYVDPGAYVKAGEAVVRVVAVTGIIARFGVSEERVRELTVGQPVKVLVDAQTFDARVDRISPEIESASRTVLVEASSPAIDGLCRSACNGLAGRIVRVRPATGGSE